MNTDTDFEFRPSIRELILKEDSLIKESIELNKKRNHLNVELKRIMDELDNIKDKMESNVEERVKITATLLHIQKERESK